VNDVEVNGSLLSGLDPKFPELSVRYTLYPTIPVLELGSQARPTGLSRARAGTAKLYSESQIASKTIKNRRLAKLLGIMRGYLLLCAVPLAVTRPIGSESQLIEYTMARGDSYPMLSRK
jgi:hypothetical protein